ncbi:sensor histidine kinase [Actinoplanes couchii]|uniref:histidine kinase n=1 Tax=Actinoplanes couchii TaxID=403638 RepID=A0ABQ3XDT7_9ACTN|nr:sensor histidine kinase [Actinoplanes couchii]MDR6317160.1 signal transduction histidine kinase [Actinoplanes couchii]GID56654.1 hypothetical protein Aco03nite_050580 [Actinoplanes couchii]
MPSLNRAAVLSWCGAVLSLFLVAVAVYLRLDQVTSIVVALLSLLPLRGLLRRQPVTTLVLLLLLLAALTLAGPGVVQRLMQALIAAAILTATGVVAARRTPLVSLTAAALTLVAGLALTAAAGAIDILSLPAAEVLAVVTAWVIGNSVRQRRAFAAVQRARSEAAAVQTERLRIAREVHDMVAHSIGVIAVQAGMGRRVIDTQPVAARDALAAIEDTSRETLAALRRMLGTLRRPDTGPAIDPGTGPGAVELAPAPGLADLEGLVARTRKAGVHVDVRWIGDHGPLPPDIDVSAFRIVQEALTNVIRHAGTGHCEVTLTRAPTELTIEITDDGPAGPAVTAVPASGAGHGLIGHGLIGMRERVALLAGDFSAGPRPGGGFRVTARVPVPS